MIRRHGLGLLVVLVVLVVVALVVVDLVVRAEAQKVLANRVRSDTGAQSVSVHIGAFPFLYEAAFSKISTVEVVADGVPVGVLRLSQVTVHAKQVELDHHDLLFNQKVQVVSVASATIAVLIKNAGLSAVLGRLDAQVSVENHHDLVLSALGHRIFSVDLTTNRLIPDCDFSVDQVPDGYLLSCVVSPVPASLLGTLSSHSG